ncbi:MAG: EAL domain-containing protein [Motiliproteus sp.]
MFQQLEPQLLRQQVSQRSEEWVSSVQGTERLLETVKVPIIDPLSQSLAMVSISRDETERRRSERAVLARERKYRELIEGLDETLYRVNVSKQQFDFLSASAVDVFGYPAESLVNSTNAIDKIIHPESARSYTLYWDALCRGEMPLIFRYAIVDNEGGQRWLQQSAKVLRDNQNVVVAVEGICRDITQSQQTERLLGQVSSAVSGIAGKEYLDALMKAIAEVLGLNHALVAKLDANAEKALVVAMSEDGESVVTHSYQLQGTPCQELAELGVCVYSADVQQHFPDDSWLTEHAIESYIGTRLVGSNGTVIGIMSLLGCQALSKPLLARSLLDAFAPRAAVELERIENDRRLRKLYAAVDQSPVAVAITNNIGVVEYVNNSLCLATCYSATELLGRHLSFLRSDSQSSSFYQQIWRTIRSGSNWHGELQQQRKDGSEFWASSSIYPVSVDDQELNDFVLIGTDVTEQKLKDSKLKMANTVFDTTSEAIIVSNSDNIIQMVNPAFSRISGYSAQEAIGRDPGMLSSGHHDAQFYSDMKQALHTNNHWQGEIWNRRKNGEMYPEWLSIVRVLDQYGAVEQHVAVFSDMSKRKETEGLLYQQANYDLLTELPNRMLAQDRLNSALRRARKQRQEVAVLHIGLNRFKWVNDTYGHDAGDALLKLTGQRLLSVVGESDTVARLNGDEFLVVLPDIRSSHDAEHTANAIGHRLSKPFQLEKGEAFLKSSIGIALYPLDARRVDQLMHHADTAMWRSKESSEEVGYYFYTVAMNREAEERAQLELDLRQAITNQQFEVYYQPLVDLATMKITGAEALIRWHHPTQGLISPARFIPLAEETGLIVPIGRWVLQTVCQQLNQWQGSGFGDLRVAVNMSPKQCFGNEGVETIRSVIVDSNVATCRLVIEITESMLIEDQRSLSALRQLRGLGVKLSMDDFGTGYSSLSYLKHFPIDILKIDRSFIKDLPDDRGDGALVEAIIAMAGSLGLDVVAEGVETQAQNNFLTKLNCNYIQGFLYSKPVPLSAFEAFVKQYNAPAS